MRAAMAPDPAVLRWPPMSRLAVASLLTALSVVAACGDGGGFPDAALPDSAPPGGTVSIAWSVTDANAQPIPCGRVLAQSVTMVLVNRNIAGGSTEVFPCSSSMGTSSPLRPGTYDIRFELRGTIGMLATAPEQMAVEIVSGQNTELAPLAFSVDATGGMELTLDAGKTGGNCAAMAMMGAGITQATITLRHTANGMCEPVTFTLSGGGTYTVNCATPTVLPRCIETTETLTVDAMPSGSDYLIQVRARGTGNCYTNDDTLAVPPLGNKLMRTLALAEEPLGEC